MISLFLFSVISVIAAGGPSPAETVFNFPVDKVPIQIMGQKRPREVTTLSGAQTPEYPPGFPYFVATVTKHVAAKLDEEKISLDSPESQKRSLLQFVLMPVGISESYPLVSMPGLEGQPAGVCRISSPWIDLAVERGPVPQVRAIVRYSESQLLADQAVLAGARNVPPGVARRLTGDEFDRYMTVYHNEELSVYVNDNTPKKPIEELVPPDLLWLLKRARSGGLASFTRTVAGAMKTAMITSAEGYTEIVIALIDRCFESDGVDIRYDSILDVADLVQLEQYKIDTLFR